MPMFRNTRSAEAFGIAIRTHVPKPIAVQAARRVTSQGGSMHARRACRTDFGATAAGVLLFVLRNALGTWNVPHLS